MDYRAEVRRGARFMDARFPGWESKIDLETLNIVDPCKCIVGQVAGPRVFGALVDTQPGDLGLAFLTNEARQAWAELILGRRAMQEAIAPRARRTVPAAPAVEYQGVTAGT